MKVAFRTDASLDIGTGHVMRCLTLALALREAGADCHFITRDLEGHRAKYIEREGFEVSLLPRPCEQVYEDKPAHAFWAGVSWEQDAEETRAVLAIHSPDWLVMDHYAFDARWQRATRPAGAKLMVIDDLADRPHVCDLLLDQNLGHAAIDYEGLVPNKCMRFVGPQYALLRPEFHKYRAEALARRAGRADRALRNLLISLGGVDKLDVTSVVLNALHDAPIPEDLRITVIMGGNAPALGRIRALVRHMPWPTQVVVDVADMGARMVAADLAIGAVGTSVLERVYMELPMVCIPIAENQRLFTSYLRTYKLASVLEVPQQGVSALCSDTLWAAMRAAPIIPPHFAASVGSGIYEIKKYILDKNGQI